MIALLMRSAGRARFVIGGAALLLCGFQIIIVGQAAQVQRSNAFASVANLLPAFLQRGLGSKAMLLATFKGTVAFGYFHPVVCLLVAVVAMYLTTEVAHEVESGLVDVELARAVPRRRLLTRSLILAHAAMVLLVALMWTGTWLGVRLFDAGGLDLPSLDVRGRMLFNLFALGSCFAAFALLAAAASRRWSTAFTFVGLVAVVAYIIDFLALGWPAMQSVAWLSPFHYYPALSVLAGDAAMGRNLTILFAAAAAMNAAAYWQFQRRDL
jgi:ABC-type transport system involved in multi-copper enzyme maturation permease subunit